jgi:hypothetical protein
MANQDSTSSGFTLSAAIVDSDNSFVCSTMCRGLPVTGLLELSFAGPDGKLWKARFSVMADPPPKA